MTTFMIKHKSSGKFIHPRGGQQAAEQTQIVLFDGYDVNYTIWEFESLEKEWGYIKHVASGKYLHPDGGLLVPEITSSVVMHTGKHAACLFAIDEVQHVIVHRGSGNYLHPAAGKSAPDNETKFVIHPGIHLGMQLQCVDPADGITEVHPYGKPMVAGHWKIIHMVKNPLATHKDTISVTIGKSETESSTSSKEASWTYKWEAHAGASIEVFSFGGSQSISSSVKLAWSNTSSHTY